MPFCNQTELLRRLLVDQPGLLGAEPWSGHLRDCSLCSTERQAYEQSLAVFRHFETGRLSRLPEGPSWEQLSAALEQRAQPRRMWIRRIPMAAAVGVLVLLTGFAATAYVSVFDGGVFNGDGSDLAGVEARGPAVATDRSEAMEQDAFQLATDTGTRNYHFIKSAAETARFNWRDINAELQRRYGAQGLLVIRQSDLSDPTLFQPVSTLEQPVFYSSR